MLLIGIFPRVAPLWGGSAGLSGVVWMEKESFLIKQEKYLEAGIHIGTKLKTADMSPFIYRTRPDRLYVLDLRKVDERIRLGGKQLGRYQPQEIAVVASREYSRRAASKFCEVTGCRLAVGRFIPGMLTNVGRADYMEPKLVFVCDPKGEAQAVIEAGKVGIATVGLCDTDNATSYIDWVIPCNNKGRKSLALVFYLLAREAMMGWGKIKSYDEFSRTPEEFEGGDEMPKPEQGAEGETPVEGQTPQEAEGQKRIPGKKPARDEAGEKRDEKEEHAAKETGESKASEKEGEDAGAGQKGGTAEEESAPESHAREKADDEKSGKGGAKGENKREKAEAGENAGAETAGENKAGGGAGGKEAESG